MIDLHTHILPGLDDGPGDLDASAAMAAAAVGQGTTVMAATSHINRSFALSPADLEAARVLVEERLRADGIALEVVQGGEIAASRVTTLSDEELARLTLGGSRWVLLECPLSPSAAPIEPTVDDLRRRGFAVLLAHPERSPAFMRSPEPLQRLVERGALAQVTATAFTGEFGGVVRRTAFAMVERRIVHVLASDAHDAYDRPPGLGGAREAFERRYADGREQFDWLTRDAPGALLAGEPLPPRPDEPRAKGGLLRRFKDG